MLRNFLATFFWLLSPWKLKTQPAPQRPTILIGAPHTSNWDWILMLAVTWKLGIAFHWVGKHTLFSGWKGPIMKLLGGISIDRDHPESAMASMLEALSANPHSCLVIAPDGTRGDHKYWKSGFYRIAQHSGLPLTLAFVDRHTRTAGIGPTFHISGDLEADMDRIRLFYRDKSGFRPENRVEPRLRNELSR